jgi:hypothetical protein
MRESRKPLYFITIITAIKQTEKCDRFPEVSSKIRWCCGAGGAIAESESALLDKSWGCGYIM